MRLRFIGPLAKFDNLVSFDFEDNPGAGMTPNQEFDDPGSGTITRSSKMNEPDPGFENDPFAGDDGDAPF